MVHRSPVWPVGLPCSSPSASPCALPPWVCLCGEACPAASWPAATDASPLSPAASSAACSSRMGASNSGRAAWLAAEVSARARKASLSS